MKESFFMKLPVIGSMVNHFTSTVTYRWCSGEHKTLKTHTIVSYEEPRRKNKEITKLQGLWEEGFTGSETKVERRITPRLAEKEPAIKTIHWRTEAA